MEGVLVEGWDYPAATVAWTVPAASRAKSARESPRPLPWKPAEPGGKTCRPRGAGRRDDPSAGPASRRPRRGGAGGRRRGAASRA